MALFEGGVGGKVVDGFGAAQVAVVLYLSIDLFVVGLLGGVGVGKVVDVDDLGA